MSQSCVSVGTIVMTSVNTADDVSTYSVMTSKNAFQSYNRTDDDDDDDDASATKPKSEHIRFRVFRAVKDP